MPARLTGQRRTLSLSGAIAGYSGKSLGQKLGVKAGTRLWLYNPPNDYGELIGQLPAGATIVQNVREADIGHAFLPDRASLAAQIERLTTEPRPGAALWISWPKKTSAKFVDLTEGGVRDLVLPTGWVDVKVCAVNDDWSGLKFLRRRT